MHGSPVPGGLQDPKEPTGGEVGDGNGFAMRNWIWLCHEQGAHGYI